MLLLLMRTLHLRTRALHKGHCDCCLPAVAAAIAIEPLSARTLPLSELHSRNRHIGCEALTLHTAANAPALHGYAEPTCAQPQSPPHPPSMLLPPLPQRRRRRR